MRKNRAFPIGKIRKFRAKIGEGLANFPRKSRPRGEFCRLWSTAGNFPHTAEKWVGKCTRTSPALFRDQLANPLLLVMEYLQTFELRNCRV